MRIYAFAIVTAALFAVPTSALSQSIEFGPGGVRVNPGYDRGYGYDRDYDRYDRHYGYDRRHQGRSSYRGGPRYRDYDRDYDRD